MKKKLTVTIGIPAFNEEKNIKQLLMTILSQKQSFFVIKEVLVVSDSSEDDTPYLVRQFNNRKIKLLWNKSRMGQNYCQNKIFSNANSDFVVLIEADTCPMDKNYLHNLLKPFIKGNVDIVQGNESILTSKSLVGSAIATYSKEFHALEIQNRDTKAFFCSGRGGRGYSKKVYKNLRWPSFVPEDAYAHLWSKQNGIKTVFVKRALCQYKVAQTYKDFQKSINKNISAESALRTFFVKDFVEKVYKKPIWFIPRVFSTLFLKDPISLFIYLTLWSLNRISRERTPFNNIWPISESTKVLFK